MKLPASIRPCEDRDLLSMRAICAACDDPAHPGRLAWVLPMYCDFYVEQCKDTCFVAVDAGDTPVGYILCAPDQKAYRAGFVRGGTLKRVFSGSLWAGLFWLFRPVAEAFVPSKPYRAHLHIDILPEYRKMGVGRRLMDALFAKLKERGVPGVMLCCAAKNTNARRFYERLGFVRFGTLPGAVYYGMRL